MCLMSSKYKHAILDNGSTVTSIADPGGSIPDPDFYPFLIPEKNVLSYIFCSHKIENYFIFELILVLKKN